MDTDTSSREIVFGQQLRKARKRAGLTQSEMAERLTQMGFQLSQGGYSHYERGIRFPDPPLMRALADIVETSLDYLSGSTETDAPVAEIEEELAAASGRAKINRLMERMPKDRQQQVIDFAEFLLFQKGGDVGGRVDKVPAGPRGNDDANNARSESNRRGIRAVFAVMRRYMTQDEINDAIDEMLEVAPEWHELIARAHSSSPKDSGVKNS